MFTTIDLWILLFEKRTAKVCQSNPHDLRILGGSPDPLRSSALLLLCFFGFAAWNQFSPTLRPVFHTIFRARRRRSWEELGAERLKQREGETP